MQSYHFIVVDNDTFETIDKLKVGARTLKQAQLSARQLVEPYKVVRFEQLDLHVSYVRVQA